MWSNRKQELEEREARLSHLSKEFKTIEFDSQVAKTELKSFKESLALLLSEGTSNCQPHDDVIKERIKALQIASRENNTVSYTVINFSSCFIISMYQFQSFVHYFVRASACTLRTSILSWLSAENLSFFFLNKVFEVLIVIVNFHPSLSSIL